MPFRRSGRLKAKTITLAHGGGGKAMRDLIDDVFIAAFDNPAMGEMEDQARLDVSDRMAGGGRLAFTTDSFVVDPLVFPGGDIGKLAVWGTVNDLAVGGATPLWLSAAFIIEEGVEVEFLRTIAASMRAAADSADVAIVTGDTKVVERGSADKLFITTAGIGIIPPGLDLSARHIRPGDLVLVNASLGEHGAAILAARGEIELEMAVTSDCRPLNRLVDALLAAAPATRAMRDATRGGIAAVLNEMAVAGGVGIVLEEAALPMRADVGGFCEILGLDPLYLANEGVLVAFVPEEQAGRAIDAMRCHPFGEAAAIIGSATEARPGVVVMNTTFGGTRIVDMLIGEQLPRIC
ncbi:MAG: hydrogenase expression/formation protein HypE [Sphingomonas sp.]|uniref:hydrogenase expression/formation protein HypE n=1 Tax=Sphingomonas sp. TaxID=28214 RepID=UPI00184C8AF2|nr:hydrogenase expression/formation protein HypE [Sphingomonas sp.]MBA3667717.1 hydrogenase expression/formation protein HypE [Sphingomonas sp.]